MSTGHSSVRTPSSPPLEATVATMPADSLSFDERWDAWRAKGEAHDRAVRRKLTLAAPFVAIVAGAILYALLIL